jgi:uncharacterized protein (DUF433 family)
MASILHWAFQAEEVERLTKLPGTRLQKWARDFYPPAFGGGLYSFRDLVALRVLAALRLDHDVSRQELRRAGEYLRRYSDDPWSKLCVGVAPKDKKRKGTRVAFKNPNTGQWECADETAQELFHIAIAEVFEKTEREVRALRQRTSSDVGRIDRHRGVMGNADCIAGTRIPVSTIADYLDEGRSDWQIIELFPQLTPADIEAVRERKLARAG